jgi:LmbE family N-acetylglucosaminyl deacetylase
LVTFVRDGRLRVMGINAHPDDESMYSGTIARLTSNGHEATLVYMTGGDKGDTRIPPDELIQIREKEAVGACKILGAKAIFLRLPDHELFDNYDTECKLIEAMREVRPHIIITHDPHDYDRDHWTTSQIVLQCVNSASLKHYKTKSPAMNSVDAIYFCDTVGGLSFDPELWIDITNTFDRKIRALRSHKSQLNFMKGLFDMDMVDFHTTMAKFRGIQVRTKYAEAFRRFKVYPHIGALTSLPR